MVKALLIYFSGQILDSYDCKRLKLRVEDGMQHSYRNDSLSSRFEEVVRRDSMYHNICYNILVIY